MRLIDGKGGYEMTRIKIVEIYLSVLIIAGVVALLYVWMASPLGTSDKVGITMAISTVALVIVTSIYAWHTRKMADEMRKQTENLRETVSMSVRPSVSINITRVQGGDTYPFEPPSGLSTQL